MDNKFLKRILPVAWIALSIFMAGSLSFSPKASAAALMCIDNDLCFPVLSRAEARFAGSDYYVKKADERVSAYSRRANLSSCWFVDVSLRESRGRCL